ncbi:hypothetical protein [Methylobacterium sp. 10]|uniref:hypothetical protein n=1 Tax=Methylobacterium sp. 10 TaxID=1101191 RepID=UPI0012DFC44A|nr:hypothetical protein [Methylobacterium sp. 10]
MVPDALSGHRNGDSIERGHEGGFGLRALANAQSLKYDGRMSMQSPPRLYYSARASSDREVPRIDLDTLKTLFLSSYEHLAFNGYFDEAFGSHCVDAGFTEGTIGSAVDAYVLFTLMKKDIWPIKENISAYNESDLFDVVEFLHDHVSRPRQKDWHSWDNCGYHYGDFDAALGKADYRERINKLLQRYGDTYELNERG